MLTSLRISSTLHRYNQKENSMFKLMKKSDLKHLQEKISDIGIKLTRCQKELDAAYEEIKNSDTVNEELRDTIRKLEDSIMVMQKAQEEEAVVSDTNSVELAIANDLTTVTPTIKFRRDVFEKMVELGYLSDKDEGNAMAIQVALMTVSFEALQQIIEAFSEPVED